MPSAPSRLAAAFATGLLGVALALAGCAPPPEHQAATELPTEETALVAQAKKEGQVVLGAGGHTREQAQLLADGFQRKYGIPVNFIRETSGDIARKTQAQLSAGAVDFDVISLNDETTLRAWDAAKALADPAVPNRVLILSGLVNSSPAPNYLPFTWSALGYSYNTTRVPTSSAPKTWSELAARQSTFAVSDPGTSGAALTYLACMQQIDPGFLPALKGRKSLVASSALALTQMLATGEADFGLPAIESEVANARRHGEPLAVAYPDGRIGALPSFVAALNRAKHPAAARLLVRYQLSEELQRDQAGQGSRSVLGTVAPPQGAEQLAADRLVMIPADQVKAQKAELVRTFKANVGG